MDPYTCVFKTTFYLSDSQAEWKKERKKQPHQNKPLPIRDNPQGKPALEIILPYNYPVYNLSYIFSHRKMQIWKQSWKKMPENPGKALTTACLGMAMEGEKCVCN